MAQNPICPEHEELAAFAEGKAREEVRRRVLQHLDQCDHCREIVVEAHLFLQDAHASSSEASDAPEGLCPRPRASADDSTSASQTEGDKTLPFTPKSAGRRVWWWGSLAAAFLLAAFLTILDRPSPTVSYAHLIEHSTPSDSRHLERAEQVFQRLLQVSDKSTTLVPSLVVLDMEGGPYAHTQPGDSVLLSESGLDFCYQGVTKEKGDARLAYVLAHELTHLEYHEYGHAFLDLGADPEPVKLVRAFQKREREVKEKEERADDYAMIYAAMAGFQPRLLLEDDSPFFEQWARQLPIAATFEDSQNLAKRAQRLVENMRDMATYIDDFFHKGLGQYRAGEFLEARKSWMKFYERFPGREVSNNLGLTWHQQAAKILADCDGRLVMRFRLPLQLAEKTLAERAVKRGVDDRYPCFQKEAFQAALQKARSYFEEARKKDPTYLGAPINQACGYLLEGNPVMALTFLQDLKEQGKTHPELDHLEILARALSTINLGNAGQKELEKSLAALEALQERHPSNPDFAYNLGALYLEAKNLEKEKANIYWQTFLNLVDEGPYVSYVRDRLRLNSP